MRTQVRFVVERAGLAAALKAAIDEESETFRYCKDTLREAIATVLEPAQAAGTVRADLEPSDLLRLGYEIGAGAKYADEARFSQSSSPQRTSTLLVTITMSAA
jgi:predicted RNA-binding Zn ribbon-like protein